MKRMKMVHWPKKRKAVVAHIISDYPLLLLTWSIYKHGWHSTQLKYNAFPVYVISKSSLEEFCYHTAVAKPWLANSMQTFNRSCMTLLIMVRPVTILVSITIERLMFASILSVTQYSSFSYARLEIFSALHVLFIEIPTRTPRYKKTYSNIVAAKSLLFSSCGR